MNNWILQKKKIGTNFVEFALDQIQVEQDFSQISPNFHEMCDMHQSRHTGLEALVCILT